MPAFLIGDAAGPKTHSAAAMPAKCVCCQCPGDHPKFSTLTCLFSSCFAHRWFWGSFFLCFPNDNIPSDACRICWLIFYIFAFPVNLFIAFAGFAVGLMLDALMLVSWLIACGYCGICCRGPKCYKRDRSNCCCACPRRNSTPPRSRA